MTTDLLSDNEIEFLFHFLPLHYLPWIAKDGQLKSKPTLISEGFATSHFRSTSAHIDQQRGFGHYVHLSTQSEPPILRSKLMAGFPHVGLKIPVDNIECASLDICRYNIAKTRQLRRDGKSGFQESSENGKYYDSLQIPIARTLDEKLQMLNAAPKNRMLEILVPDSLILPVNTTILCYDTRDKDLIEVIMMAYPVQWSIELLDNTPYNKDHDLFDSVRVFVEHAIDDESWCGDGLEFDRI